MGHGVRSRRRRIGRASKRKQKMTETVLDVGPEIFESDRFFSCFLEQFPSSSDAPESYITEDPLAADEYYVIHDRVFQHGPDDDLDLLIQSKNRLKYIKLKQKSDDLGEYADYSFLPTSKYIRFVQLYENGVCANPVIKVCLTVKEDFSVNICVHGVSLPADNQVWTNVPLYCKTLHQIKGIIDLLSGYNICPGNPDSQYQHLLPVGAYLDVASENQRAGYRENITGSTIRSTKCLLFIKSNRCECCATYRRTLSKALWRQKHKVPTHKRNWLSSKKGNERLSDSEKIYKLKQLRKHSSSLQSEIDKLKRKLKKSIKVNGKSLSEDVDDMVHGV